MRNRELIAQAQSWFIAVALEFEKGNITEEVVLRLTRNSAGIYKSFMKGLPVLGKTLEEQNSTSDDAFSEFADSINATKQGYPNVG